MTLWTSISSFISYKEIAECLEINTDTDYVVGGKLSPEGIDYVFEEVVQFGEEYKHTHQKEPSEELRLKEENELIQKLIEAYISPEEVAKKLDWKKKFQFINDYAQAGSRFDFLKDITTPGLAIIEFETARGFSLTIFPSIMTVISDFYYMESGLLPEFNYEEVTAFDVIDVIGQAMSMNLCDVEKDVEEYVS